MNLRLTIARAAFSGVSTALAASALVGVSTSAAGAATVTSTYTCQIPTIYAGDFALTVTGWMPARTTVAGARVPAGLIDVQAKATVPADAAGLLAGAGATGATSPDFSFTLGNSEDAYFDRIAIPLQGSFTTSGGATIWNASGSNKAFTTPAADTYEVVLPDRFHLVTQQGSTNSVKLLCDIKSPTHETTKPAVIDDDYVLRKQASTVAAPVAVKATTAVNARFGVKVTGRYGAPVTGKVVAKDGNTVVGTGKLDKKGKAIVTLKKLKAGRHKVVLSFAGDDSFKPAKGKTIVEVGKR